MSQSRNLVNRLNVSKYLFLLFFFHINLLVIAQEIELSWAEKKEIAEHYIFVQFSFDELKFVHQLVMTSGKKAVSKETIWHFYGLNDSLMNSSSYYVTMIELDLQKDRLKGLTIFRGWVNNVDISYTLGVSSDGIVFPLKRFWENDFNLLIKKYYPESLKVEQVKEIIDLYVNLRLLPLGKAIILNDYDSLKKEYGMTLGNKNIITPVSVQFTEEYTTVNVCVYYTEDQSVYKYEFKLNKSGEILSLEGTEVF